MNQRQRKYYFGSGFVLRHNQMRPVGRFQQPHWSHAKGIYGDLVWMPDDVQFILLQLKDTRPDLARGHVRDIIRRQSPAGRLATHSSGSDGSYGHGPYLFAWSLLQLHQTAPDTRFLSEIYGPLCRFHRWMFDYWKVDDSGLIAVRMPTQAGYDNNPSIFQVPGPVLVADVNACMVLDARVLARLAEMLGKADQAAEWRQRAEELGRQVRAHFFRENSQLFFNRYVEEGSFIQVKALQCMFFPILAGLADEQLARRTIERYLINEDEFFTPAPFPDVARSEMYHNQGRHSGTTFLHWSLMGLVVLARYAYKKEAEEARRRIITFVTRSRVFWQYWCPDGGGFDFRDMARDHRYPNVTWAACYGNIVRRDYERFAETINDVLT